MFHPDKIIIFCVFLLAIFVTWTLSVRACESIAYGDTPLISRVMTAISALRPTLSDGRVGDLATVFVDAGQETEIDPLLLVALARRESGLRPSARGNLGEIGLLQVHGVGLKHRPEVCARSLTTADCQVRTGAAFLQWVRASCPGSTWRWVCSYARSHCCSEEVARNDIGTRRAHRYHQEIGGREWD